MAGQACQAAHATFNPGDFIGSVVMGAFIDDIDQRIASTVTLTSSPAWPSTEISTTAGHIYACVGYRQYSQSVTLQSTSHAGIKAS